MLILTSIDSTKGGRKEKEWVRGEYFYASKNKNLISGKSIGRSDSKQNALWEKTMDTVQKSSVMTSAHLANQ